jgi:hypothetical protein
MFLLISAGLEFFVRQTVDQTSFPTILEVLYLAFWSYVIGIALLLLLPIGLVVGWLRARGDRSLLKGTPATSMSRRVEEPVLEGRGSEARGSASGPSRSISDHAAGTEEANSLTRVA